jgi:hypothetical protein
MLTLLLLAALTDTPQNCPIEFKHFNPYYSVERRGILEWRNVSDKKIKSAEFEIIGYNSLNEPLHMRPVTWAGNNLGRSITQPGKSGTVKWAQTEAAVRTMAHNGSEAYVKKIVFDDGTQWEDDGSASCSIASKDRKK